MNFYKAIKLLFRIYKKDDQGVIKREIVYYTNVVASPLIARLILTVLVNMLLLLILFIAITRATWSYKKISSKVIIKENGSVLQPTKSVFEGEQAQKSVQQFKDLRNRVKKSQI